MPLRNPRQDEVSGRDMADRRGPQLVMARRRSAESRRRRRRSGRRRPGTRSIDEHLAVVAALALRSSPEFLDRARPASCARGRPCCAPREQPSVPPTSGAPGQRCRWTPSGQRRMLAFVPAVTEVVSRRTLCLRSAHPFSSDRRSRPASAFRSEGGPPSGRWKACRGPVSCGGRTGTYSEHSTRP